MLRQNMGEQQSFDPASGLSSLGFTPEAAISSLTGNVVLVNSAIDLLDETIASVDVAAAGPTEVATASAVNANSVISNANYADLSAKVNLCLAALRAHGLIAT